jgi:hypothetical protein
MYVFILLSLIVSAHAHECAVIFGDEQLYRYDGFVVESPNYAIRDTLGCSANAVVVDALNGTASYDVEPMYDFTDTSYASMNRICCADLNAAADELGISRMDVFFITHEKRANGHESCYANALNRCAAIMDQVGVIEVVYNYKE